MNGSIKSINAYLDGHHQACLHLVEQGLADEHVPLEAACDMVYALELTGQIARISPAGANAFLAHANRWIWAGQLNAAPAGATSINVHLSAYVLGAIRLLTNAGHQFAEPIFRPDAWRLSDLLDESGLPRWPRAWSHHSWRVSHWVGGSASIVQSLWHLAPQECVARGVPAVAKVLQEADRLINPTTGLLKCYNSEIVQTIFKALYKIRHDPLAGEVGGIVHLHWVNYGAGRLPYKAASQLFDRAKVLYKKSPFLETVPFCLDFDIVQIVRTSAPSDKLDAAGEKRAQRFIDDIELFFSTKLDENYSLHKLPGALATQHEAAMILGVESFGSSKIKTTDIIKHAGWI